MLRIESFCYPRDFYWISKEGLKKAWKLKKVKTAICLVLYFALATLCFVGYYLLYPIKLLHEECESWCYR